MRFRLLLSKEREQQSERNGRETKDGQRVLFLFCILYSTFSSIVCIFGGANHRASAQIVDGPSSFEKSENHNPLFCFASIIVLRPSERLQVYR